MSNIWSLVFANLRKRKSQSISLLIFVLIAAMFLNIGLVLYFGFGSFFEERVEQLNAPHLSIIQNEQIATDEQLTWLNTHPQTIESERYSVMGTSVEIFMNGSKTVFDSVFSDITQNQSMNPASLIGESLPLGDGTIYVPYVMKSAGGYKLGDVFTITISGKEHKFNISGFTEEMPFGDTMNQFLRFYITDTDLRRLENEYPASICDLISIRLNDPVYSAILYAEYANEFYTDQNTSELPSSFIHSRNYNGYKTSRTFITSIIALIVTALAFIILIISLIVMRFGIINNIEESMVNIGIMKAVGYRNNQIVASILLQFGGVAVVGGVLGIAASISIIPFLANLLESMSALIWNPGFNVVFAGVTLFFVLLAVLLVSFIAAARIYRLHPLTALRGGIATHNFGKNSIPLDKSHGSLPFLLAMKHLAKTKSQNVMIAIVITALSFASVTGISLYYTVGTNFYEFVATVAGEFSDVAIEVKNESDTKGLMRRLQDRNDVRKVFGFQKVTLLSENIPAVVFIAEDYSLMEGSMLVEGRYPKHDNEVTAGNNFLKATGKKIGDTIKINQDGKDKEFLITGLTQFANGSGVSLLMTYDGLHTLQPDFEFEQIYVYLERGTDIKTFIKGVTASESDIIEKTTDFEELADAQYSQYGEILAAVAVGILSVTAMVVILTLYLVIKTEILRGNRKFGIQKAIGFKTVQIMNQIALTYTPVIAASVMLGGIGGVLGLNPLFAILTSGLGIVKTNFPAPIGWTVITCVFLSVLAYAVSMLVALRIRKISAYSLISE